MPDIAKDSAVDTRHGDVWRSLEELARDEIAYRSMEREFAKGAMLPPETATRRQFLQVMGASTALATAVGCGISQPQEKIVPYVRAPEHIIPGKPVYYATAMTLCGASLGLLVETHMGRPTKVEGNPLHPAVPEVMQQANESAPASQFRFGATDAFAQATVLSLYDPDRSETVLHNGQIDTWDAFFTALRTNLERLAPSGGQGLRLLTESVVSPTLDDQIQQLLAKYPNARWHQYEPINDDNALLGARLAFGEDVSIVYRDTPRVVLSLDADCVVDGPMRLQLARKLRGRALGKKEDHLPRLYVVETSSTVTGAVADHRLPASPAGVAAVALAVAKSFDPDVDREGAIGEEIPRPWLDAVLEDLRASIGRSLVLAGRQQPPAVHALAHWLNQALGNVGHTIEYREPIAARPEVLVDSLRELVRAMNAKEVEALVILSGNPVFDAPADLEIAGAMAHVPFTAHLSQYANETSIRSIWHVPKAHLFESWGDTRAGNGTASIEQPLIAPLHGGKTAHEMLAALMGQPIASGHDLVRDHWRSKLAGAQDNAAFERAWQVALHDGVVAGTQTHSQSPRLASEFARTVAQQIAAPQQPVAEAQSKSLQLAFRPDPSLWDGGFANNGWLQELPRPFTKLTWDNAALMSPRTADQYRVVTGDVVEIKTATGTLEIPAFVVPGHPNQTVTVHLGYGRQNAGRVGNGVGTNVYPLRTSDSMWFAPISGLRKTGRRHELATTQHHFLMDGRNLVRAGTLAEYRAAADHPKFMQVERHEAPHGSLYPEKTYDGYKWGMVVNQSACIGCNACVVACQAENNIPVVGKDQVWRGREMHWLRIDNYYAGDAENPAVYHQPVFCMHCENAPCEPVCPVAATTHSAEGLNEMTYNRCVGTRYCANNCPYKVRRFNFYDYNAALRQDATLELLPNPDVTVRSRGVMEKCTYCVQRINAARIDSEKEGREIRDGEILTACQAACPTQALTFGNLNDAGSVVRGLADSGLNYSLLEDLNTRPRTTYLAVVRNPNPKLVESRMMFEINHTHSEYEESQRDSIV
jgi:MoCo/4Fe-4S cofactor protein with predicted Tat translocation signal